jgi:hypothetical protein
MSNKVSTIEYSQGTDISNDRYDTNLDGQSTDLALHYPSHQLYFWKIRLVQRWRSAIYQQFQEEDFDKKVNLPSSISGKPFIELLGFWKDAYRYLSSNGKQVDSGNQAYVSCRLQLDR